MDNHLNVFYCYHQGNLQDADRTIQLEDNITRALIVTFDSLSRRDQKRFLHNLLPNHRFASKIFSVDLQNRKNMGEVGDGNKYLLTVQRARGTYSSQDINRLSIESLDEKLRNEDDRKQLINRIRQCIQNKASFDVDGLQIPENELPGFLGSILGSRADGWIFGDKEIILIEAKIGGSQVGKHQIYRHCVEKRGFGIDRAGYRKNPNLVEIINLTWDGVANAFQELLPESPVKSSANGKIDSYFLIRQFKEYLIMTGQKLDLSYLTEKDYDVSQSQGQFRIFTEHLADKLTKRNTGFQLEGRPMSGLWQTIVSNKYSKRNPHYSFSLLDGDGTLGISLTTNRLKSIDGRFIEELKKFARGQADRFDQQRFFVQQEQYRLIDHRKGQIQGEGRQTFLYRFNFLEGLNKPDLFDQLAFFSKLRIYKQFDVGWQIQLFDFSRIRRDQDGEEQIRAANKEMLENAEGVLDKFVNFIESTQYMYELLILKQSD